MCAPPLGKLMPTIYISSLFFSSSFFPLIILLYYLEQSCNMISVRLFLYNLASPISHSYFLFIESQKKIHFLVKIEDGTKTNLVFLFFLFQTIYFSIFFHYSFLCIYVSLDRNWIDIWKVVTEHRVHLISINSKN